MKRFSGNLMTDFEEYKMILRSFSQEKQKVIFMYDLRGLISTLDQAIALMNYLVEDKNSSDEELKNAMKIINNLNKKIQIATNAYSACINFDVKDIK